jgi:lysophospholipase L1-like esterase
MFADSYRDQNQHRPLYVYRHKPQIPSNPSKRSWLRMNIAFTTRLNSPRLLAFSSLLILIFISAMKYPNEPEKTYTYLALGDSYTIGEQVPGKDNFPNQVTRLLNEKRITFQSPTIIAKTGWTTDELQNAIDKASLKDHYDFVSLLIGVNNQYRGYSIENYAAEFESLLKQAIDFANNEPSHVIVLSIPDWGITPFAEGRNRGLIAKEIDDFNTINKQLADRYQVHYIDITPGTRKAADDGSLLAADGLHPSGKEYSFWAHQITDTIENLLQR